jgi:hypothetical protein
VWREKTKGVWNSFPGPFALGMVFLLIAPHATRHTPQALSAYHAIVTTTAMP